MASIDQLCVNTIRTIAADMVQTANSGHPGMPMGMAPIAHALWSRVMNYAPSNAKWWNRDRFLLSNGHGCCLQYVLLHLAGYKLTIDDLKKFRQLNSKTPGHPESFLTEGIEVTTGPLGQGIANGVGIALAESHIAAKFNRPGFELFNSYTYVFAGDGCMQEGVASEAASLAGHWKLNKLIVIYDDNGIQIDGHTSLAFSEDVPARFRAYGWHTIMIENGDMDVDAMTKAINEAKSITDKPTLISVKTTIGFGSNKQGTEETHGAPLGAEDLKQVKTKFGFDPLQNFVISNEVYDVYKKAAQRGEDLKTKWEALFADYQKQFPNEAHELQMRFDIKFPADWKSKLPKYTAASKADATRNLSGQVLNAVASVIPALMGGSADLTPSNKTDLKGAADYSAQTPEGRYIRFGVREHGMAAIGNGMSSYGALIPYTATFLNFIEYCFPAVRLSALSQIQQLFIMTHDSIGLGEDGPTHQPIEALALCRATPNILVFRPADGNETVGSYISAMEHIRGPSVFSLTRQNLPHLEKSTPESVALGAYVVFETAAAGEQLDLVYVASGSEVSLAIDAAKAQPERKIRVVSMPCDGLFDRQSVSYRRSIIPPGVPTISLECLTTYGFQKYAHAHIGMTTFGASGPLNAVMKHFGFTAPQVVERTAQFIQEFKEVSASTGVSLGLLSTHHVYNDVKEFHH